MTWTLVIFIYAGSFAQGDSVAIQALPNWTSLATCEAAAIKLRPLVKLSTKEIRTVCLQQ